MLNILIICLLIVLLLGNFGIFIPLPLVINIVDWLHLNWNKLALLYVEKYYNYLLANLVPKE